MSGDSAVPYGIVISFARAYEEARKRIVSPHYRALNWDADPMADKKWVHYERGAALMEASGCTDADEWMRGQFRTASKTDYPHPNNLYSERAVRLYLELADAETMPGIIKVQVDWLTQYQHIFPSRTVSQLVLNPLWAFDSWFRVYYAVGVSKAVALDAQKELQQSTPLRKSISDSGHDLDALETKIQKILSQGT